MDVIPVLRLSTTASVVSSSSSSSSSSLSSSSSIKPRASSAVPELTKRERLLKKDFSRTNSNPQGNRLAPLKLHQKSAMKIPNGNRRFSRAGVSPSQLNLPLLGDNATSPHLKSPGMMEVRSCVLSSLRQQRSTRTRTRYSLSSAMSTYTLASDNSLSPSLLDRRGLLSREEVD